ncbi:MAG: HPr family phosphocarrier protein [Treponemataceae bacterium]|nr:MAG: HPr family phosphocarrier protein [Treponemataceae bacterium]
MRQFSYTITDPLGIHARPAGELVKKAKEFQSEMTIAKGGKSADLKKLFAVLKLGVKHSDTIEIAIEGADEQDAEPAVKSFLESNL